MGGAAVGGRGCSSILRALARSSLPWPTAFVLRPRMRFEVAAAYAMGIGLPLLETLRRRTNFETISGYVDDFLAGALLLYAARAFSRGRPSGPVLLVVAWSSLAGGLYGSFFGQLESSASHDVGGLPNTTVVIIKGILYLIALTGVVLSARTAISNQRG
jgi:hypothetical protein